MNKTVALIGVLLSITLAFAWNANAQAARDTTIAQTAIPTMPNSITEPLRLSVVSPPQFKVGDSWTYAGATGEYTWRIKEISSTSVVAENSAGIAYRFSREGNLMQGYSRSGREVTFSPSTSEIKFPLEAGMTWKETYSGTVSNSADAGTTPTRRGREGGQRPPTSWSFLAKGAIHGVEEITVPAGTFKAWKIEHTVEGGDGDDALVVKTCWYAEQTKRFVKCTFKTHPGRDFVLVKYVLEK